MVAFRFGVSAPPLVSRAAWQDRARRLEDLGYAVLLMPDHLGSPSCLAPLVSAAEATTALRVGTLVANSDFFRPLRLAQEAATVDVLVDHRLELGLGSGWARGEYETLGVDYDPPPVRAERLGRAVSEMRQAWTAAGAPHPRMLIGGHGDTVLRLAAQEADIIGFTGLTWKGSSLRPTGVAADSIAERVAFVRASAGERFERLEFNALVQVADIGASPARVDEVANAYGLDPPTLGGSPFALLGDVAQVVDKLVGLRERLGLSYYVIFDPAADAFAPVVAQLAGH